MKLKSIELSGFKSFAKTTVLEFPEKIVAIVGPNGSGKSNIAEAIRWVLGEQSMKALRGKRGEDLIFSGTPKAPAMGKASVTLHFNNTDRSIPLDFDTVSLGRKIFRDGLNEYYLNGSQVRLKDVVELLAKMGLGETKHNIIGQGEVDRILLASSRDRRDMLEEALGLRVYQLRKKEALRKLKETEMNMEKIESLVREIAPHLRYLKNLKEKAEQREVFEKELYEFQREYFSKAIAGIDAELSRIHADDRPLSELMQNVEDEIIKLQKGVAEKEEVSKKFSAIRGIEEKLREIDSKRSAYERELGRLEGKIEIELERSQKPIERIVDLPYVTGEIRRWHDVVKNLLRIEGIAEIRHALSEMDSGLRRLLEVVARGTVVEKPKISELLDGLEQEKKKFQELLSNLNETAAALRADLEKEEAGYRGLQQEIRNLDRAVREKEEERSALRIRRERARFETERLEKEKARYMTDMEYAGIPLHHLEKPTEGVWSALSLEELRGKIEKLKIRLDEIGGVDAATLNEYASTEERHAFLSKEMADLTQAKNDLYGLIQELDQTIERDFEEGFRKVQHEFQNYFKIIFGGGKAVLRHEAVKKELDESSFAESSEETEEESDGEKDKKAFGIEIEVDLPRKRIKSMSMLSGGERALTAIALLFAISAVNPPPFLVLDETDAALDEANSKLYAETLKELSQKTDLVIITHNRETMKQAGVLYGVTMSDDGISKLLSIQFEQAREYANR